MSLYRGYAGAKACSTGPTAGARALMAFYLGRYKRLGGRNDGIFNCRSVRGGSTLSLHAEGRAGDLGCPEGTTRWSRHLAGQLKDNSAELGVQCVIHNRKIWSGAHPDAGWRDYDGVDPHTGHIHVELSRTAAKDLTVDRIVAVLVPAHPAITVPKTPAPSLRLPEGHVSLNETQARILGRPSMHRDQLLAAAAASAVDSRRRLQALMKAPAGKEEQ